jgi:hypothetical protein
MGVARRHLLWCLHADPAPLPVTASPPTAIPADLWSVRPRLLVPSGLPVTRPASSNRRPSGECPPCVKPGPSRPSKTGASKGGRIRRRQPTRRVLHR